MSADYDYYVPSFDGDSIWNFFAGEPMNDVGLRANVDVNDQLSVAGGAHVRVYDVQTAAFNPVRGPGQLHGLAALPPRRPDVLPDQRAPVRRGRGPAGALADGRDQPRPALQRRLGRRGRPRRRRSQRRARLRVALRRQRPNGRLAVGRQATRRTGARRPSTMSSASDTCSRRGRRGRSSGSTTSAGS